MTRAASSSPASPERRRRRRRRPASGGPSRASASSMRATSASVHCDVAHARRPGPEQQLGLVALEHPVGGRPDQAGEAEQVVDELGPAEHRPHAVERGPDLGHAADAGRDLRLPLFGRALPASERGGDGDVGELLGRGVEERELRRVEPTLVVLVCPHEGTSVLLAQVVEDLLHDERPALVVGASPAPRSLHEAGRVGAADAQHLVVDHHHEVTWQRTLSIAERLGDDGRHAGVGLDRGNLTRLRARHRDLRLQAADGGELHVLFTERREHLVDVAQERPVRPDQQHAAATRGGGGACRGGTPARCSATAVLPVPAPPATTSTPGRSARIASSCSDWIVATMSPMRPVRRRSSAASSAPSPTTWKPDRSAASSSNTSSSMPSSSATAGVEVPAADDPHGLDRGCPVERLRDRGAPVDDERALVVVGDRDAADVVPVAVGGGAGVVGLQVEAAEHQGCVADLERRQSPLGVGDGDVALEPGLVGPAPPHLGEALGDPPGGRPHLVEPVVGPVDIALLGRELGGSADRARRSPSRRGRPGGRELGAPPTELEGARAGEGDPGGAPPAELEGARAGEGDPGAASSGVVAGSAVDSRGSSGTRSPREGASQLTGRTTSAQPIRSSAAP